MLYDRSQTYVIGHAIIAVHDAQNSYLPKIMLSRDHIFKGVGVTAIPFCLRGNIKPCVIDGQEANSKP